MPETRLNGMKILYISSEGTDARDAATALRGVAPDAKVFWASRFDQASAWIRQNRDLMAMVVEAQLDSQDCSSFLEHVHGLGLSVTVVVVVPEELTHRLESLANGAYAVLPKNDSLFRNLPGVITRAIERGRERASEPCGQSESQPVTAMAARSAAPRAFPEMQAPLDCAERAKASDAAAAAKRYEQGQTECDARLADAVRSKATLERIVDQTRATSVELEQKLARAETALQDAEQRHLAALTTAAGQLAKSQAEHDVGMARAAATRDMIEEQLRAAATEVARARQHQASAAADVDRLSRRESELSLQLAEVAASHGTLKGQLAHAEMALGSANERSARERLTAAEEGARRQAEFRTQLAQEVEQRQNVEKQLARAATARDEAAERHASAMTTAAERLAERQAQFDAELTEARAARDALADRTRNLEAALRQAGQDLESRAAAIERLTQREAELTSQLADAATTRDTLERQLADVHAAMREADERATSERVATAARAAAREAELDGLLGQERAARANLEHTLSDVEDARREAEQQHTSAMAAAAVALAESRRQLETARSETTAARESFERQLDEAQVATEAARHDHASVAADVERLTQREAELASQLADGATTRDTLERQLADVATAMREADEHATRERSMAAARQADAETRLAQQAQERDALDRDLAETRSAAADAERRFRADTAAMTARAGEHADRLEKQIARERFEHENRLAAIHERLEHLVTERDALDESLGTLQERSQRLDTEQRAERERIERARLTAEAEIVRLGAQHAEAQNTLEGARRNFQHTLDRASSEHADALATLSATVAERDAQLEEQVTRHSAALQAAAREHGLLQDGFQTTIAARELEIEQLQGTLETTTRELDVTRSRRDILQNEADRLPQLQEQLDVSRAELRRQFEHSPLALFRCTQSGALTQSNRALAALAGHKNTDAMRGADFATTVFESPDDLFWLIERCLRTNASESVETVWRTKNGGRLAVRLSARPSAPDVIEILVEDLTNLRAIENRLREAHRMEAVGRLASEVAVTCGNLLRDVHQNARGWLTTVGDNTALGRQGDMLLDEVARAASFLQQLAAYSDGETSTVAPVDLNKVLRDLKPVLKRVAGGDVELGLSKTATRLMVDVEAERVERLLVNVASYRRDRMPLGRRLRIELATVVVDRRFTDKHPNVRQGPHALITVTEIRRAMPAEGQLQLRSEPTAPVADRAVAGRPGVDLGALQGLIRECGGHLWMTVEPQGDMVVKMRLPLSTSDVRTHLSTSPVRGGRGRALARWFQH